MKKAILALLLMPSLSFAGAFELYISQRNIANTATLTRTMPLAALNIDSVFGVGRFDNLPVMWKLGTSMGVINDELVCGPDWTAVVNKPTFSPVATSGDYNDLINKPSVSQVNSDWNAMSGVEEILNKPELALVATSGAYADLSGAPAIPSAQINSDWSAASGVSEILNKPTTLAGYGITDAYPASGNPSNFLTGVTGSQVIAALGFTPYNSANTSNFVSQSGARAAISLTTIGTSGAATYNSGTGVLNIPAYAGNVGTVTSVTAGSGLSGGAITGAGTISMPAIGTSGSYSGVSTDSQGRVSAGTNRSQSAVSRTLNAAYQISATRDVMAFYSVQITVTASISGGQNGEVVLEMSTDNTFATGVQTVAVAGVGQTYTLAVALQGVQPQTTQLAGYIPAGYYARLRTVSVTGTPTFVLRAAQEVFQ